MELPDQATYCFSSKTCAMPKGPLGVDIRVDSYSQKILTSSKKVGGVPIWWGWKCAKEQASINPPQKNGALNAPPTAIWVFGRGYGGNWGVIWAVLPKLVLGGGRFGVEGGLPSGGSQGGHPLQTSAECKIRGSPSRLPHLPTTLKPLISRAEFESGMYRAYKRDFQKNTPI